jgi:hypothetical protein
MSRAFPGRAPGMPIRAADFWHIQGFDMKRARQSCRAPDFHAGSA